MADGVSNNVPNANTSNGSAQDGVLSDGAGFQWSRRAILQLIKFYVESEPLFESPAFTQKQVWKLIAEKLNSSEGFTVTALQVDTKWRGLNKTYRKVKEHNSVAGNAPRKWEFYSAMEEVLEKRDTSMDIIHDNSSELPSSAAGESFVQTYAKRRRLLTANTSYVDPQRPPCDNRFGWTDDVAMSVNRHLAEEEDYVRSQLPKPFAHGSGPQHGTAPNVSIVPDWYALLQEDLEERRRIRQQERQKILALLERIAEKL